MSQGKELLATDQWIYGKLAGDSQVTAIVSTRVYAEEAPQGATYPLIVFRFLGGVDKPIVGGGRLWVNVVYLVEAIAEAGSFGGNLATLAGRIDALLHAGTGTATDGTVWACVREQPFRRAETGPGGQQYRRLGGRYRLLTQ